MSDDPFGTLRDQLYDLPPPAKGWVGHGPTAFGPKNSRHMDALGEAIETVLAADKDVRDALWLYLIDHLPDTICMPNITYLNHEIPLRIYLRLVTRHPCTHLIGRLQQEELQRMWIRECDGEIRRQSNQVSELLPFEFPTPVVCIKANTYYHHGGWARVRSFAWGETASDASVGTPLAWCLRARKGLPDVRP